VWKSFVPRGTFFEGLCLAGALNQIGARPIHTVH
jgi:hypothetical protein